MLRGRDQLAGSWRLENSPIYSLSAPSPFSPTIYAGIEGKVAQIDIVSIFDKHPDPVFGTPPQDIGLHKLFWDPEGDLWDVAMYDHAEIKKLFKQTKYWGSSKKDGTRDERWQDLSAQSRFSQGSELFHGGRLRI
jgi:hypothetical protein